MRPAPPRERTGGARGLGSEVERALPGAPERAARRRPRRPASIERAPYDPRRLEALVAYVEAHRPSPYINLPARRLLSELAPPAGVIELRVGGRTALVAAVVDRCENLHDAALLEVLGLDEDVDAAPLFAAATSIAVDVARAAGRPRLSMALPAAFDVAALGWAPAEESYVMERDLSPFPPPPLPAGAAWEDLSADRVGEHYDTVRAAFAADPGMLLPDLPTFAASSLAADPPVRVLRVGGAEAAFARVSFEEGGRVGYVATIGRAPAWRGGGLGRVVLAEALRVLAARKVARFRLGVTGTNAAAVALYRRSGFEVVDTWRTWRREVAQGIGAAGESERGMADEPERRAAGEPERPPGESERAAVGGGATGEGAVGELGRRAAGEAEGDGCAP